jgi:group I intron endonuclease
MIGIYKITSPSGKIYIGQSVNVLKRISDYKKNKNVDQQPKLYNSFLKYGTEKHIFEKLCECEENELNDKERYYQDFYNVIKNGLNCRLTKSKDRSGFFSEETKNKMKLNHSRYFKGKKLSKKHCEKISKGLMNHTVTKETKEKISATRLQKKIKSPMGMLGKSHRKTSREKISKSLKGNNYSSKIILDINSFVFYESLKEYSILYGYKPDTFRKRISKGLHKNIIIV